MNGARRSLCLLALLASAGMSLSAGADAPPMRYRIDDNKTPTNLRDDTVLDTRTGLRWQRQDDSLRYSQAEAQASCASFTLQGEVARLPTRKELQSLVDVSRAEPAIDPAVFPGTQQQDGYWTATTSAANASEAWEVNFIDGVSRTSPKSDRYFVRCVR